MYKKMFLVTIIVMAVITAAFAQTETDFEVGLTADGTGAVVKKYLGRAATVRIPATIQEMPVKEIGRSAFNGNAALTSVVIPEGVEKIDMFAFYNCGSLASVTLPESLKEIMSPDYGYINGGAFQGCVKLTTIRIPNGVTYIGRYTFAGTGLTSITLSPGITKIEASTFYRCSKLTSIVIPEGVVTIESAAFSGCLSLRSVTLPESLTRIADITITNMSSDGGVFEGCSALTTIVIPNGVSYIGRSAFENSGITSITLPSGITKIADSTFRGCKKLASIVIPEGVKEIGSEAFGDCSALTSVTLPSTITTLARSFKNCSSLTTVTIPDSVSRIGDIAGAFQGCPKLNLVTQARIQRLQ
jgi:hypothetical protein